MKKIVSIVVIICLLFSLIGCSHNDERDLGASSNIDSAIENVEENTNSSQNSVSSDETSSDKGDIIGNTSSESKSEESSSESAVSHIHKFSNATCTKPKTCTNCGVTSGASLGHKFAAATCTKPQTCTRCSATKGAALGYPDIYGEWRAITKTPDEEVLLEEWGECIDVVYLEFEKDFYTVASQKINASILMLTYSADSYADDWNESFVYNGKKYYNTSTKGYGATQSNFTISGNTITFYPVFEEVGGGKYYEKIIFKFDDYGNLVVNELVGSPNREELSTDVRSLYVGLKLVKE